jgi:hypothetical protein
MIPEAVVSHRTAHRLRIKVPSRKRDEQYFGFLVQSISAQQGIETVEANPVTGSIVIVHETDADTLLAYCRNNSLFSVIEESAPEPSSLHRTITDGFEGINRQIRNASKGSLNMGGIAFLALVGVGAYQIARGNFAAPAWYTAFWYALNIFLKSRDDDHGASE